MGKVFMGVLCALLVFFVALPIGCTMIVANAVSTTDQNAEQGSGEAANATNPHPSEVTNATNPSPSTAKQASKANAPKWSYSTTKDQMRGTTMRTASVRSNNSLQFDFPYGGGSYGTLLLRHSGANVEVAIVMDKGQFTCDSFSDETIAVKFDGGVVREFGCTGTSDGRADALFILREHEFLDRLTKSQRVITETQFFQAGRKQLTFDVQGLKLCSQQKAVENCF